MSHDNERPILQQIHDLVAEEHALRSGHAGIGLNSEERTRLETLERELDRCWDLLRHRRAAEEFGKGLEADAANRTAEPADPFASADD